jgi:mono/diheme cytochrome c family protein
VRALVLVVALATAAAAATPEDVALYGRWCARCHGEGGDGKGPAATALAFNGSAPRDFTAGRLKLVSVAQGTAPLDEDLARTIARGVPGTSMPAFHDLLAPNEIARLVAVVRGFAPAPRPPGVPIDLGVEPSDGDASRAHGAALYHDLGCPTCHGEQGHGDGPSASQLRASDRTSIRPADLTRPWTFKGGDAPGDVAMRLAAGIGGTPMPSYLEIASKSDLWDLAHWILSIRRAPSLQAAAIAAARAAPDDGEPPAARGEYLAKSGTCFLCHAQMQPEGGYVADSFGAGGMRVELTFMGRVYTRNLTPDPDTGLGQWSAADLGRALRDGRTPSGRVLSALDMPWPILADVTDRDVEALHAYLRTLPPVRNLVPPPVAPSLADGIGRKLRALVAGTQLAGIYVPGNAGQIIGPDEHPPAIANPLADVWIALAGALLAALAWRRVRVLCIVIATAIVVVYAWPPLRWMPAALVKATPPFETLGRAFNLPPVRRPPPAIDVADDDTRALVARGRYVATLGTCSLCHTAGPSITRLWAPFPEMGGGMRVNWKVFGTVYSRNLTPDRETGLGGWTDEQIKRAITTGLARDGRTMHWQAMPWDHFSRLSPEDLEALVAYLRHVPPVRSSVPAPVGPQPADGDGLSFGFGYGGSQ